MTEAELSILLKSLGCPVAKWKTDPKDISTWPRCVYWPYVDEDIVTSGERYTGKRTYQISIYAKIPEDPVINSLRDKLRAIGLHPVIYHEYVIADDVFHSYMSLEVISDE